MNPARLESRREHPTSPDKRCSHATPANRVTSAAPCWRPQSTPCNVPLVAAAYTVGNCHHAARGDAAAAARSCASPRPTHRAFVAVEAGASALARAHARHTAGSTSRAIPPRAHRDAIKREGAERRANLARRSTHPRGGASACAPRTRTVSSLPFAADQRTTVDEFARARAAPRARRPSWSYPLSVLPRTSGRSTRGVLPRPSRRPDAPALRTRSDSGTPD